MVDLEGTNRINEWDKLPTLSIHGDRRRKQLSGRDEWKSEEVGHLFLL